MMQRTFHIETLGCRLNQFESDALGARLEEMGLRRTEDPRNAEILLLNSCTVTETAHLQSLRRAAAFSRTAAKWVFVLGCAVPRLESLKEDGRVVLVPNAAKSNLPNLIEAYLEGEAPVVGPGDPFDYDTSGVTHRTRAFLKIQDGCDGACSYCVVPLVRGRAVSRPAVEVVSAARRLIARGVKEIVLTGINLARYRVADQDLVSLLRTLLDLEGDFRVRLSSVEPQEFGEDFYELFTQPRMAAHLHLSLQSGSDAVLRAMRRPYDRGVWRRVVTALRRRRPDLHLSTDVIVGFPGEGPEDFEATLDLLEESGVGRVHPFPFSPREGTEAYALVDRPDPFEVQRRMDRLRQRAAAGYRQYLDSLTGLVDRLLVEKSGPGGASGWVSRYVYVTVPVTRPRNSWVEVRFTRRQGPGASVEVLV